MLAKRKTHRSMKQCRNKYRNRPCTNNANCFLAKVQKQFSGEVYFSTKGVRTVKQPYARQWTDFKTFIPYRNSTQNGL